MHPSGFAVRSVIKNALARILFASRLTSPYWRGRGRLSIATFHRVLPKEDRNHYPYPGLAVTPQELDTLLSYFVSHFDCGTLASQHDRLMKNDITDRPLLALTFDDGQFDNYKYARPLLDKYCLKASFFIPVNALEHNQLLWHDQLGFAVNTLCEQEEVGSNQLKRILIEAGLNFDGPLQAQYVVAATKRLTLPVRLRLVDQLTAAAGTLQMPEYARPMSFAELAQLASEGHEIGSHSMTHCMMTDCNDEELTYELTESRLKLQERLQKSKISSFCYPNGNFDDRTVAAVVRAGYFRAVTTRWGSNMTSTNCFQLNRFDIDAYRTFDSLGQFNPDLLAFRMSGFYPVMIR
ncbi:MAG: polysaccharide deacetylase family protein [Steroidobacteraceae bacterium]